MKALFTFALLLLPTLASLHGCAHDLHFQAQRQAVDELHCAAPGLRVRAVGVLQSLGPYVQEVSVFDAEGCNGEQRYYCMAFQACEPTLERALERVDPGLERALWLLRTQTRGRCPGEELRVVQESESLFVLEACDGRWEYHCRDAGCERLH